MKKDIEIDLMEVMEKVHQRLDIISKIDVDDTGWPQDIKGQDPIEWARKNGKTIEGLDPDEWLKKKSWLVDSNIMVN